MPSVQPDRASSDLARPIRFGYFLVPNAADPLLDTAREIEDLGFDLIGVQDHPYQRRFVETWSLLAMVLARTSRITVFPDVANLALRPPAVLAKTAASLDVLSGGRVELGLGAGGFWDAIAAYGGPRRTPGEALRALEEAVAVIRAVWSGERNLRYTGEHYQLAGAQSGPVPAHPIGIWLGTYGPRALRLTARVADGWVPSLRDDVSRLADMTARLNDAAAEAGRDPAEIQRIVNVNGTLTDGPSEGLLHGPPSQWVHELTDIAVRFGVDAFVLWTEGAGYRRFAEHVAPAVRAEVARLRAPSAR
jgi:alkanesulfonate monooxygenase SsuD/methylene tetrahydromethanopterin reductase-like flavin-dependent oxidoreductase (luciferase family)